MEPSPAIIQAAGNFYLRTDTSSLCSEDIDLNTYQNLSTIAGTPLEMDARDDKFCDDHNY